MSDLAPFVAAAIRDKVVVDMLEENRILRQRLLGSERITITGQGGSPIYAEGYLSESVSLYEGFPESAYVDLVNCTGEDANEKLAMCKARDFEEAEVRLGGHLLYTFANKPNCCVSSMEDNYGSAVVMFRENNDINFNIELLVEFGPLPQRDRDNPDLKMPDCYSNEEIPEIRFLRMYNITGETSYKG